MLLQGQGLQKYWVVLKQVPPPTHPPTHPPTRFRLSPGLY